MRNDFAEEGIAREWVYLLKEFPGMNLPGVRDIGDLTAFQRMVLISADQQMQAEANAEAEADAGSAGSAGGLTPNAARRPGGGGKRIERKRYVNKSAETGRDPEELIAEYRAEHGLDD